MSARHVTFVVACLFAVLALVALFGIRLPSVQAQAVSPPAEYVPGEILIKFRPAAEQTARLDALGELEAVSRHVFRSGAEHWLLGEGVSVENALAALGSNPDVLYAEPNLIGELTRTEPDDDLFPEQWALENIQAPEAWDLTTGSSSVVIAVIDTGIETGYPDLSPNKWTNPNETENGIDDDGNGYVDDVQGWDFADDDNDPTLRYYSSCYSSHGTPVAGIIGAHAAESGGFGIAGINWSVKLMNLRGARCSSNVATLTEAVDYAVDNGAHIINMSVGILCDDPPVGCSWTLKSALERAGERDILVVTGAGNSGEEEGVDIDDLDFPGIMPASYDLDNIIVAAGSDPNDLAVHELPSNVTNYGSASVDLAAPGIDILTLADPCMGGGDGCDPSQQDPNDLYDYFDGTSAATPHVTGVAGLVKSLNLGIPYELIRLHILDPNNLDPVYSPDPNTFPFVTVTDGRVNAYEAVADYEGNAPAQITDLSVVANTSSSIELEWTATADDGSDPNSGAATLNQIRYSTSSITSGNWLLADKASGVPTPGDPNTSESFTVAGVICNRTYYFALKSFDEWGNGPLSNVVSGTTRPRLCVASFCPYLSYRCTWTGNCGAGNCCIYECEYDETCTYTQSCPGSACNCS